MLFFHYFRHQMISNMYSSIILLIFSFPIARDVTTLPIPSNPINSPKNLIKYSQILSVLPNSMNSPQSYNSLISPILSNPTDSFLKCYQHSLLSRSWNEFTSFLLIKQLVKICVRIERAKSERYIPEMGDIIRK